jgi:ATP-dependent RNA helicase DeaD
MERFKKLGLSDEIIDVLVKKGFEKPTPIQEQTIPAILCGTRDVIGQAQTGTGKTAAFGLPIIELIKESSRTVQALVLTPTRELAIQVAEEMHSLKGKKKLSIVPIYGGQSIDLQLRQLKKGVDIVVGTPGRVIDHIKRKTLKLSTISFLVLDEADEMLNMGFLEEVAEILKETPEEKRTMLFSATMPQQILSIAKKYMKEYDVLKVNSGQLTAPRTDQIYFEVSANDKFEALCRIIDIEEEFYGLIFCRTRVDVDQVASHLSERGYDCDGLHGDMSQAQREKILDKFKKGRINILVATDVAARGIDVQNLTHVINFALPQDPEAYVHRIGRTGRAGKEGNAITFITPSEYRKLQFIQRIAKTDIRKGSLPKVQDVIDSKKKRIQGELTEIIASEAPVVYTDLAQELLKIHQPEAVVAALLNYTFEDELDARSYTEISDVRRRGSDVDMQGKTRLFVRQGKDDGLSIKSLVNTITENCGIDGKRIRDVVIRDKFSFVTLPFNDAEIVLAYFKNRQRKGGLVISKAKTERSSEHGSSRPSRPRTRRNS